MINFTNAENVEIWLSQKNEKLKFDFVKIRLQ